MNHIIDMNGNSVFFGQDFMIKESIIECKKELILYVVGRTHLLAREAEGYSFSKMLPGKVIQNFKTNKD